MRAPITTRESLLARPGTSASPATPVQPAKASSSARSPAGSRPSPPRRKRRPTARPATGTHWPAACSHRRAVHLQTALHHDPLKRGHRRPAVQVFRRDAQVDQPSLAHRAGGHQRHLALKYVPASSADVPVCRHPSRVIDVRPPRTRIVQLSSAENVGGVVLRAHAQSSGTGYQSPFTPAVTGDSASAAVYAKSIFHAVARGGRCRGRQAPRTPAASAPAA